jgi:hypothetical protein
MASMFDAQLRGFRVFDGIPRRGIFDSDAWPPWVRRQAKCAQQLIALAGARNRAIIRAIYRALQKVEPA